MITLLTFLIGPATAADPPDVALQSVILYDQKNFGGDRWHLYNSIEHLPHQSIPWWHWFVLPLPIGVLKNTAPPTAREADDRAASLRVMNDAIIRVYEHPNYQGHSERFSSDAEALNPPDRTSSVKFLGNEDHPYIVLYEHTYYNGDSRVLLSSDHDLRHGGSVVDFDDTVTSILVSDGAKARICEHPYGGGRCVELTDSVPDLRTIGMDDAVSSVIAEHPHVILYEHLNYTGNRMLVTGSMDIRNEEGLVPGFDFNDQATSLAVYGGASVTINKHPAGGNTGTDAYVVTDHVPDLRTIGMNDTITYVEID